MNKQLTPDELRQLSIAERLELMETIWDSSAETPEALDVPDWHKQELDKRLAAHAADPSAAAPWSEVKAKILDTLRK